MLSANGDIITSAKANFKLSVELTNYYLREDDTVIFTVNRKRFEAEKQNRIYIVVEFFNELDIGNYKYDLAIERDGKVLTILEGDFVVRESLKAYLLSVIHRLYREDSWVNNLFDSAGMGLSEVSAYLDVVKGNLYFDTATETQLRAYEKEAGIVLRGGQTEDERKSQLMAKWRGSSKCTLATLQSVADSWRDSTIKVEFINGKIHIQFISSIGIPRDLEGLKKALENVKPAHLPIYYSFKYKTWGDVKAFGTWGQHKANGTWGKIKSDEGV